MPQLSSLVAALAVAVGAAVLSAPASAQTDHSGHMATPKPAPKSTASLPMTAGVVKKVDAGRGEVMIAHDDIKNLDMPKMTMGFRVKDPAWLKKLRDGDRIRFAADMVNGELTMVSYEATK